MVSEAAAYGGGKIKFLALVIFVLHVNENIVEIYWENLNYFVLNY